MKKFFLMMAVAAIGIAGCRPNHPDGYNPEGNLATPAEATHDAHADTVASAHGTAPDMHNAQNSLDWNGTYKGTLPCASCPGIETTLVLKEDNTFELTEKYLEEKEKPFVEKGKFTWAADGTHITLQNDDKSVFMVMEGMLKQLDADGKEVTGELADKYTLKKQQ